MVPGGNGVFKKTIVSGGEVIGTWARDRRRPDAPPSCLNRLTDSRWDGSQAAFSQGAKST